MADGVLLGVRHLRTSTRLALWLKTWVVAMAARTARRPDDSPLKNAMHVFNMLVWPGQRQDAVESGRAGLICVRRSAADQFVLDAAHAHHGVACRAFPVGRDEARLAVERS